VSQSSLAAVAPHSVSDDVYIPFEKLAITENSLADVNSLLPQPFAPPPPPELIQGVENDQILFEEQSEYEPEIELSGTLVGSTMETVPVREGEYTQNDDGKLEQIRHELSYKEPFRKSVPSARTKIERTKVTTRQTKAEIPEKVSPSRQIRLERYARWKETRLPPIPKQITLKSTTSPKKKVLVTSQPVSRTTVIPKPTAPGITRITKEERPRKAFNAMKFEKEPISWTKSTEREQWMINKAGLKAKFGDEAWNPRKKLSPDALEGIRTLHAQHPEQFTTPVLADHFKVSPEVIRRILKSKWRASAEEEESRRERWDKRGERIWSALVESGVHAPKKWREMGIGGGPRRKAQGKASIWKSSRDGTSEAAVRQAGSGSAWVDSLAQRLS